jgi:hypothetical protein
MSIKPGRARDLAAVMESEIIPRRWREEGFQDAIILIAPGGLEAIDLSLWSRREDADRQGGRASERVRRRLAEFLDAAEPARTFQVWNSTFHAIRTPSGTSG